MERIDMDAMQRELRCISPAPARKITLADRWDYTVAELRQVCREHGMTGCSRWTHDQLVTALREAGVDLPAKPAQRFSGRR